MSAKDIIADRIEQLKQGEAVSYKLTETFGGGLAVIELNPKYPGKGRKYILSTEEIVNGSPSGKRRSLWDSDKPRSLAEWVIAREGKLFS